MEKRKKIGFAMGISAAVLWGTFGTFSTFMYDYGLSEGTISLIAPLFLAVFFFILVAKNDVHNIRIPKALLPALALNGLSSAAYNYTAVQAYAYLPIGVVSPIIYCNLFLLIIISRIVFKTPITWQKIVAVCGSVIGIAMVVNIFGSAGRLNLIGVAWALAAMASWASLVTFEKYLLIHEVDGNAILVYEGVFSLIFISVFIQSPGAALENIAQSFTASGGMVIWPILAFGFFTTVLCYWLYINALDRLEPAYVQISYTMDPVTSCILGLVIFGQILLPVQIIGIAVILSVVIWIQWIERGDASPAVSE